MLSLFVSGMITLRGGLVGALLFLVTFAISLAIVAFIMVKIPDRPSSGH